MAAAGGRRSDIRRSAVRWTYAAVIAVIAVLAVVVHHQIPALATHMPPPAAEAKADGMAAMGHGSVLPPAHPHGHTPPEAVGGAAGASTDGACSGMAMQHCSAARVDTMKPLPAAEPATGLAPAGHSPAAAGRDLPATVDRAPPDLSLLSRLLL